jgi:hypothetical protein
MHLNLSTVLHCTAERAFDEVMKPELMMHIAQPIVYFTFCDGAVPARWEERQYRVRLRLFKCIPFGIQVIQTSGNMEQHNNLPRYVLRDNGHSALISTWDHVIRIHPLDDASCHYTDELTVSAGILTPVVWLFAAVFYRWRQRRWRAVVRRNFLY